VTGASSIPFVTRVTVAAVGLSCRLPKSKLGTRLSMAPSSKHPNNNWSIVIGLGTWAVRVAGLLKLSITTLVKV